MVIVVKKVHFVGNEYLVAEESTGSTSFGWTGEKEQATKFVNDDKAITALKRSGYNALGRVEIVTLDSEE